MSNTALRLSGQVIYRPLAQGGGLLLHLQSGEYHRVNATGAAVCNLLNGSRNLADVQREVLSAHADADGDVAQDVQEFVLLLEQRGLLDD